MTRPPQSTTDPAGRVRRLTAALGDGPHSREIDLTDHLRCVLVTLGDQEALRLLERKKAA